MSRKIAWVRKPLSLEIAFVEALARLAESRDFAKAINATAECRGASQVFVDELALALADDMAAEDIMHARGCRGLAEAIRQ